MLGADFADRVVHDLRIYAEERRQFVPREVEQNSYRCQLLHHLRRDVQERAIGVVDDGALEADLVDFFGKLVNFRMGCMAEKERDVAVGAEVHDVADFWLQFTVLVEIIVADLYGLIPRNWS